jgi:uncharacterized membrane protein
MGTLSLLRVSFLILLAGALLASVVTASHAVERGNGRITVGQVATTIDSAACSRAYRDVARGMSCQGLFDFQRNCRGELNTTLVTTALRLRCADELVEQKYKMMQLDFAKATEQNNCAAMTGFVDRHATDFDVVDASEMEKANVLRIKLCEQEARDKELAAIEANLRDITARNECSLLREFENKYSTKLSPDQTNRLAQTTKQRCDFEAQVKATLKTCLDRNETAGNFCGGTACYRSFRDALPETYFAPYRTDSQRHDSICRESTAMRNCLSNDPCGGERCSLPLRVAISAGPLLKQVEQSEKETVLACTAKQQRELNERLEAGRQTQRRLEEARVQARRDNTFKLTICNRSNLPQIHVALSYYDYDANGWVREGWWHVDRGDCNYIGDRFKRGTLYFYAANPKQTLAWSGDFGLCVVWTRFRDLNRPGITCSGDKFRKFRHRDIFESEYTLTYNN